MMQTKGQHTSFSESVSRRHEISDIDFRRVIITGLGLLGLMVTGLVYSWLVSSVFSPATADTRPEVTVVPEEGALPPLPRLQPDPHAILLDLRRGEDSTLSAYGWASRESSLVMIPIERAMKVVVEKGMLKSR